MLLKKHPITYPKRPISAKNTIKTMTPPKKLQAVVSFDSDPDSSRSGVAWLGKFLAAIAAKYCLAIIYRFTLSTLHK